MKLTYRILSAPAGMDPGGGVGAVANTEGGGSGMDVDESDNEEDVENQTPNQKKRGFDIFSCISFSPISTDTAASAYRATAQTVGRLSNSAQSAVRSSLNSAQSRLRPNSSNEPIRTVAELEKLLKEYDNNLFKVLLRHKISDVSLLGELTEWRKKKILLSSGLDGTKDLIKIATGIHEFFLQAEAKSLDPKFLKILVLPNGQNLDKTGVLYTGDEQIPINATTFELVYLATIVLMEQFRMEPDVALIVAMNSTVVTSVIPITLPHDAGSAPTVTGKPTAGDRARIKAHENYKTARDDSEAASKQHIDKLAQRYKFTHAIVFGSYPWKFYNTHLKGLDSFKNIKVMQKFALIHPSALRDNKKSSKRQAFEASFSLTATFGDLAGGIKPAHDITLDGPQFVLNQYIARKGAGSGEHFYGAWYKGELVLLEHGADELKSLIKVEVSSLQTSCANLKRSWGRATSSEFPKQEDLVARLSGVTNQGKTISYYHFDIGVFHWKDCLKDEAPEGSLRDYGLPPLGKKNTYKNITMGVQNDAVLRNWGAYVERNAPVQRTRNSQLVARTSASLTAAADDEYDDEIGDGFD